MSRSTAAAQPATRITAHSSSLICNDTDLRGQLTIGENVIVHPKASILALGGPIVIGEGCVIEELVVIVNRRKDIMRIGSNNHFMVGCRIESPSIGDNNTFQAKSKASSGVTITHHCTLGANTVLLPEPEITNNNDNDTMEVLPPYTVVYGQLSERRICDGTGEGAEQYLRDKHAEYLREVIPKFNRMRLV